MGSELSLSRRWLMSPTVREHHRELEALGREAELAAARVAAISRVAKYAVVEATCLNSIRAQAERMAPLGVSTYAMIEVTAAASMAAVIAGLKDR